MKEDSVETVKIVKKKVIKDVDDEIEVAEPEKKNEKRKKKAHQRHGERLHAYNQ